MKKDIQIMMKGLQQGSEDEPIILKTQGTYHFMKGSHYIRYEERLAEHEEPTKNTIKISPKQVSITRKGVRNSQMVFDAEEITQSSYPTPYGNIDLDITTTSILLSEQENELELTMNYTLSSGSSPISEHQITVKITPGR